MNCAKCPNTALLMTERQGVEIDYCPVCRGVWLDRGELDKLIDRAALRENNGDIPAAMPQRAHGSHRDFEDSSSRTGWGRDPASQGRRKKSWMSEIFD